MSINYEKILLKKIKQIKNIRWDNSNLLTILLKGLFSCLLLGWPISIVQAQQICGYQHYLEKRLAENPGLINKREAATIAIYERLQSKTNKTVAVITIPVVVHVVWHDSIENISDAQIQSQIAILNEDFGMLNADTVDTRSEFKSIAADAQVQFCLTIKDPNGNSTTGITRTYTTNTGFSPFTDYVKSTLNGGINPWPTSQYLNLWVCNITNPANLLGYTLPPWFVDFTNDGVVIDFDNFGDIADFTLEANYNKGRTATHEIGHYFGVFHPYGNGDFNPTGCYGMNDSTCLTEGDQICDTPPEQTGIYSCVTTPNTCAESPINLPDMYENFMDQSYGDCKSLFTQGQADRIHAVIDSFRVSIKTAATTLCAQPPVGIQGQDKPHNEALQAYPNPTEGIFTLQWQHIQGIAIDDKVTIRVYNFLGAVILSREVAGLAQTTMQLDLSKYAKGIYLVSWQRGERQAIQKLYVD